MKVKDGCEMKSSIIPISFKKTEDELLSFLEKESKYIGKSAYIKRLLAKEVELKGGK